MSTDILRRLHPNVLQYVEAVLSNGHIGVIGGPVRFGEPLSGCMSLSSQQKENICDRVKVHIPYAGRNISWQIIFNSQNMNEPPDFIFGQDDEEFIPELEDIKSLVNWNAADENSLLYVLREIICLYREHQQALLEVNRKFQYEYTSLLETKIYADFEVHRGRKLPGARDVPINFLIRLPINFQELPEFIIKENQGEDIAILLVTYQNKEATKVLPQLYLSPRIERALGGSSTLRIPSFPAGSSLLDYIPHVCELLQNMVEQISKGYRRRKEYIAAFLSHYGKAVVEYDVEGFYRITFLFEHFDFFCTLHIDLPMYFPREQPIFHFQSIYHIDGYNKPYTSSVNDYPYSPRWTSNEMAQRAKSFFIRYIQEFKALSVRNGRRITDSHS